MVRLPALRSELQIIHAHDAAMKELCDAYDEATQVLSGMRNDPRADLDIIADYEAVCRGIEEEVIELCSSSRLMSDK